MAKRIYGARPITLTWVKEAKAAMKSESLSQEDIAEACGCSQAAVSKVIRGAGTVSRLVEPISDRLGISLPLLSPLSPGAKKVVSIFEALSDDGKLAFMAYAELLAKISSR